MSGVESDLGEGNYERRCQMESNVLWERRGGEDDGRTIGSEGKRKAFVVETDF